MTEQQPIVVKVTDISFADWLCEGLCLGERKIPHDRLHGMMIFVARDGQHRAMKIDPDAYRRI